MWPDGILPAEKYLYAIPDEMSTERQFETPPGEWKPLEEADERIHKLMQWVYNYHVTYMDDCWVTCYEETVFEVKSTKWGKPSSPWEVALSVFDFWDSVNTTVLFRLAG